MLNLDDFEYRENVGREIDKLIEIDIHKSILVNLASYYKFSLATLFLLLLTHLSPKCHSPTTIHLASTSTTHSSQSLLFSSLPPYAAWLPPSAGQRRSQSWRSADHFRDESGHC